MKHFLLVLVLVIGFASCSDKEPAVTSLKKNHSIEVTFETKALNDTAVLMITHQNVYLKGNLVKTINRTDTLPAPGDSLQRVEVDGMERVVNIPKEYEFFVTVK